MENKNIKQDISFLKIVIAGLILAGFISYCIMYYKVFFLGNYYMHASFFIAVLFGISPIILGYGALRLLQFILKKENN